MKSCRPALRASVTFLGLGFGLPAVAAWNGEAVVTGIQNPNSVTISFSSDGANVPATVLGEDENGNVRVSIAYSDDDATAGTMTISSPGSAPRTISTPAAAQNQNIYVDVSGPGSATLSPPLSALPDVAAFYVPANQFTLSGSTLNLAGETINTLATNLTGGPGTELPTQSIDYDFDATGGGLGYQHNFGSGLPRFLDRKGVSSNLTLGLSYGSFSDSGDFRNDIPVGTASVGYLNSVLYPAPNDSTGANFGAVGSQSLTSLKIDVEQYEAYLDWLCNRRLGDDAFLVPNLSFGLQNWDIDMNSLDTFEPTFPSALYYNSLHQSLEQDIYTFGLGATIVNPLGGSGRFDLSYGAGARLFFSDADLQSRQETDLAFGTPEVRTIDTSEDETELGLMLSFGGGWTISDNWRLSAEIQALINVPSAIPVNPVTGDGSNPGSDDLELTSIGYDTENLWQFSARIAYKF
jgi:hypothetical protein